MSVDTTSVTLWAAPLLGLAGHEALRFYRAIWESDAIRPLKRPIPYLTVLLILGILSVLFARVAGLRDVVGAVSFGFTFTAGIGLLKTGKDTLETNDHGVDDMVEHSGGTSATPRDRAAAAIDSLLGRGLRFLQVFYWY